MLIWPFKTYLWFFLETVEAHLKFPLKEWREDFLCFIRQCKKKNFFPEVSYKVVQILWSSFRSKIKELKEIMEPGRRPTMG